MIICIINLCIYMYAMCNKNTTTTTTTTTNNNNKLYNSNKFIIIIIIIIFTTWLPVTNCNAFVQNELII